jgi:hypothetical protein
MGGRHACDPGVGVMPRQSEGRIHAQITGKGREVAPTEAHERNVMAISRRAFTLEQKARALARRLADVKAELEAKRRELRAVLQLDATIPEDSPAVARTLPGDADATTAAREHAEQRRAADPLRGELPIKRRTP